MQNNVNGQMQGFRSAYFDAEREAKQLPKEECTLVLLSLWNTKADGSGDSIFEGVDPPKYEIYWGFEGQCVHELLPGETTPFYIPVENLDQIWVKCSAKIEKTRVYYSCFR